MGNFRLPTRITIEAGCARRLGAVARELGARRALVVTDPGLAALPAVDRARADLRAAGVEAEVDARVESNPRAATAEALGQRLAEQGSELVIGLGGGSVLDAAKAAAVLATNGGAAAVYAGKERFRADPLPLVALPTTCGTGSEVTWVAVISDPHARRKLSLKGERMFPNHALVDPDLLADLPPELVASTGMDALTHALEATTCRLRNPVSDALAETAVDLILGHLRRAVADPAADAEARGALARASTLAGMAFGNADVAAVHCLSETLGGRYDVPHGLANALLLVPLLRYQWAEVELRLGEVAARVGLGGAGALLEAIEALVADLPLARFGDLGLPVDEDEVIAEEAVANGSNASSPRSMLPADYRRLLARLRDHG